MKSGSERRKKNEGERERERERLTRKEAKSGTIAIYQITSMAIDMSLNTDSSPRHVAVHM